MIFAVKVIAVALLGALVTMVAGRFRGSYNDSRYGTIQLFKIRFRERTEEENKRGFYISFAVFYIILTFISFNTDDTQYKWYLMSGCAGSAVFYAKYLIEDYFK